MELMKVVTVESQTDAGPLDFYVFRVRVNPPHPTASQGWLGAASGPFVRGEAPTLEAYARMEDSDLTPWASKTPEGHIGDIDAIVGWFKSYREQAQKAEADGAAPDAGTGDDDD
jgi:hypothetical protein